MTWVDPAWAALGLEPTTDTRAIRSAYARKLKAIDVEREPQAFVALREAFEQATATAQWMVEEERWEAEEAEAEAEDKAPADSRDAMTAGEFLATLPPGNPSASELGGEPSRPGPWQAITPEDVDAHARALFELVHGRDDPARWSTAEEDEAMHAHWRAIIADPRMQQVAYFADAEGWFANLLWGTTPFTDTLVPPVTRFFNWLELDGTVRATPGIAAIIDRYRILEFMEAARQPGSEHFEAWQELSTPLQAGGKRGKVPVKKVHRLLHTIRTTYPELEGCFDADRVAIWKPPPRLAEQAGVREQAPAPRRGLGGLSPLGWIGLIFVATCAFAIAAFDPDNNRNTPSPIASLYGLSDQAKDLDFVLEAVGDGTLKWAQVQARNPKLATLLQSNWEIARTAKKDRYAFAIDMRDLLRERYRDGLERAPYPLIAEAFRIMVEKGRALRAVDPALCDNFFSGKDFQSWRIPKPVAERERALISRTLLETDGDPPEVKGDGRFTIDPDVGDKVRARAGLSRPQLLAALTEGGTPTQRCNARIALTEVALELPPERGLQLLRDM